MLAELRKFEDARNAFARAIQSRPEFAEAHYNMSFTLSNLGDFEGALRETKRALELDPYYVAQKFELAMDVEYEDPDLSIQPDLGGERPADASIADFSFDPQSLDTLFTAAHARAPRRRRRRRRDRRIRRRSRWRRTICRRGCTIARRRRSTARWRAATRAPTAWRCSATCSRSRDCSARRSSDIAKRCGSIPSLRTATIGEAWSLVRIGRAREARPIAQRLARRTRRPTSTC